MLEEWEQIGLIAEIAFLQQLLSVGIPHAVDSWTGPLGQRHDFNLDDSAFEVKATVDHQRKHFINGVHQLEPPPRRPLALVSVLFTKTISGGASLPDHVARVLDTLGASGDEADTFWTRLALTGYTPEHADEYAQTRYIFTPPQIFPVTSNFPRITPDSFTEPLSPRISSLQYLLDLEGLPCFGFESSDFAERLVSPISRNGAA